MEVRRSVLLPYSVEDMFDLIEQAERYPEFLPWCTGATIFERSDEWVAARIEFSYLKVRFGFHTRNPKKRPDWLELRLVEGPFRHFHGGWTFARVGQLGCRATLVMNFEVADGRLDALAAPAADIVARAMVNAFVRRAQSTLRELEAPQVAASEAAHTVAAAPAAGAAPPGAGPSAEPPASPP